MQGHLTKSKETSLSHEQSDSKVTIVTSCLPLGREDDDHRLMTDAEEGRSIELNNSGAYPTCCVQLSLDGLAVNTVLQSQHINDYEGASGTSISFDWVPQVRIRWATVCTCLSSNCSTGFPGGVDGGDKHSLSHSLR